MQYCNKIHVTTQSNIFLNYAKKKKKKKTVNKIYRKRHLGISTSLWTWDEINESERMSVII